MAKNLDYFAITPEIERMTALCTRHDAIISASRRDMVGGTLYLVGRNAQTGEILSDATSCPMCRRHIINAGLDRVVIRQTPEKFEVVRVQDWVDGDDLSLPEKI